MSRLAEYRKLEQLIARQTANLETLKASPELEQEVEFETKLSSLLGEYSKSLTDIRSILDPEGASSPKGRTASLDTNNLRTRRPRPVKVYRNPLTGEMVETKGGNNKLLGAWKAQFGHEEVESWVRPL
ncbi:histone-like nucleoid-structuring protein, MvaT/MvaU family [Pseudomonas tremae]|uniref:histone-like nucleoid-structuring protein, MvaT/MvaU family n=1 Tax=Pseudomonas tremae TaxID=200454 RepID=UPI001F3B0E0C|nr:histone-like nucleoid-structuring protein, MvaT/MvaU family [Pseudomonas tremae]MCF5806073.1 transcriptional regulator [Pseudomonas tremae]MCF5811120.1 transcriptional regulator [Pseudomonas tremae]